ncbi:hypothetical protein AGMMS49940_10030 [Spirochaetia bacterium]|nr:hypothetical protein AGMMS49940_10000 [Spirochaetia bacterium]GHV73701.1 hypothetical protein AGMMS49940_10030 [Spirochaetia bacterium]
MKRKGLVLIVSLGILVLLNSCISLEANQIDPNARTEIEVLGSVTKSWLSLSFASKSSLENKAISELKKEAQRKGFKGNIDIRNVRVAGSFHILSIFYGLFQNVTASGDVVLYNSVTGRNNANAKGVEGALARAAEQTLKNVPPRSRIAIVYITAQDRSTTEYVVGELEYIWVNEGYFITDRSQLDQLRREQNFGVSGEVDDKTAASIGKIAGASVIVTGRVDGDGDLRRLRLRALDSETAQVVGVASEKL